MGLRGAGGALNKQVYGGIENDQEQQAQLARQLALLKVQDQREQLLSQSVAPYLQRGDLEGAAAAAASSGAPGATKMSMDLLMKADDRKQRSAEVQQRLGLQVQQMQQSYEMGLMRLDAQKSALEQKAQTDQQKIDLDRWYKEQRLALDEHFKGISAGLASQANELRRMGLDIQLQGLDLKRQELEQKAKAAELGKLLPSPLQKQLTDQATLANNSERFADTFKDEFGGYKVDVAGNAKNWFDKRFGEGSPQSTWWQQYELHQSIVRKELFGSAFTANEEAIWLRSAVTPGMSPGAIRANLAERKRVETNAINRLMAGAAVGYNKAQIEAFTGRKLPESNATSGGQKDSTQTWTEGDYEYRKTPDGKVQRRKLDGK
jgi:hypothetical protein